MLGHKLEQSFAHFHGSDSPALFRPFDLKLAPKT